MATYKTLTKQKVMRQETKMLRIGVAEVSWKRITREKEMKQEFAATNDRKI